MPKQKSQALRIRDILGKMYDAISNDKKDEYKACSFTLLGVMPFSISNETLMKKVNSKVYFIKSGNKIPYENGYFQPEKASPVGKKHPSKYIRVLDKSELNIDEIHYFPGTCIFDSRKGKSWYGFFKNDELVDKYYGAELTTLGIDTKEDYQELMKAVLMEDYDTFL